LTPTPAPRLHVLLARDVYVGLVIRRGPSKWFHLVAWDTKRDQFETGAWINGRIYTEKCDLSPNGELFLYSVHKGQTKPDGYTDCWTGISRPPWVFALALWPFGTTYGGGGWFSDNRSVTIRGWSGIKPHPQHPSTGLQVSLARYNDSSPIKHVASRPGKEWSGFDQRGRTVWVENGKLMAATSYGVASLLADFNNMAPHPQSAPDWARKPLVRQS
jgi:hypothetical protein